MQRLNLPDFPLEQSALIEASAGTGKTFTIAHLYLRLILGHRCKAKHVDEILVVTFTNAATAELKNRIRQLIMDAARALFHVDGADPVLAAIVDEMDDKTLAYHRLVLAARQMDEASIFTIHSFCQRMLVQHAFESGSAYQQSLIMDESDLLDRAIKDYWRRHITVLDRDTLEQLLLFWSTPEALLKSIQPLIQRAVTLEPPRESAQALLSDLRARLTAAKRWWLEQDFPTRLSQAALRKNSALTKPESIEAFANYCHSDALSPTGKLSFDDFTSKKMAYYRNKTDKALVDLDFSAIDQLMAIYERWKITLRQGVINQAVAQLKQQLNQDKRRLAQLSPDDLLNRLAEALVSEQGMTLATAIRRQYATAMIDEFQDTDPVQFNIFRCLYPPQQTDCNLILIGDPKQAIYAFRGADIFTYMDAKHWVSPSAHYTLDNNWRSRPALVDGINRLFQQSDRGFLFEKDIPFVPVHAKNDRHWLKVEGQVKQGLTFWHWPTENPATFRAMADPIAQHCASQLAGLLNQGAHGQAELVDSKDRRRALQPGDCCILVNNRNEAEVLSGALKQRRVASVFLSRTNVFSTPLAQDLNYLLRALLNPGDEQAIKAAILTELMALTAGEFESWLADERRWQNLLWEFEHWHKLWLQQGIASALHQAFDYLSVFSKQMSQPDGARRVTDLRHLSELLQQQSQQLQGPTQLIHWYQHCLSEPEEHNEGQQRRLETDANLVQIVTVHASKGLEYPVTFYPYACQVRRNSLHFYHQDGQLKVALDKDQEVKDKAEFETLAEAHRLLYVALTRAAHLCFVGVWNPALSGKKSVLPGVALGRLLLKNGDANDGAGLTARLQALADDHSIHYQAVTTPPPDNRYHSRDGNDESLACAQLGRVLRQEWRMTSYSALSQTQPSVASSEVIPEEPAPGRDEGRELITEVEDTGAPNPFNFKRGATAGTFLHEVLETQVPRQNDKSLDEVIRDKAKKFAIVPLAALQDNPPDAEPAQLDEALARQTLDMVAHWTCAIVQQPLSVLGGESLSGLKQVIAEMEFYLPLTQVTAAAFNRTLEHHDSRFRTPYQFERLNGMLKGYIDVTFAHQGRFFVADYKSNHLGNTEQHYSRDAMHQAMLEHDYYLQALLYVVALHRWLKTTLADYDYDKHVGGSVYLFLRGMNGHKGDGGVLPYRPSRQLVEDLDAVFAGHARGETLTS